MTLGGAADWNPGAYGRFRGLRLRPAIDLLAQIPPLPDGDMVDLGCGNGAVAGVLARRFTGRQLIGLDASPAMLEQAAATGHYARLVQADVAVWEPDQPPALIFSNAMCHWLANHPALFTRLAGFLAPGGTLAVQMPRQFAAPSHALLRDTAAEMFPDRFDFKGWHAPVSPPLDYARMLAPLGKVNVWESLYVQRLGPVAKGHPVCHFTWSTAMRPFLGKMNEAEATGFTLAYEQALADAYPLEPDGTVLFDFRRVFFVLTRAA